MISYHPDSRFLTDFVSGDLSVSEAVCVSAHLEFCGKCRARVQQIEALGGYLLSRIAPQAPEQDGFDRLMSRIDAGEGEPEIGRRVQAPAGDSSLTGHTSWPRSLGGWGREHLTDLQWVSFGKGMRVAPIPVPGDSRDMAIYDIKAGGKMPAHGHGGEEISVLLKGSYSDAEGTYTKGDFIVRNPGEKHQPIATQDSDCICLISLERPVKPDRFFYRLAGPLVEYRLNRARRRTHSAVSPT